MYSAADCDGIHINDSVKYLSSNVFYQLYWDKFSHCPSPLFYTILHYI